jgi:very-short-patch-repair endonuclease
MLKYEPRLKFYSRRLRSNMTDAEQLLWRHLRRKQILGVQFYRQKPIGLFIVDFYAPALDLVIELDGGQHFEPEAMKYDQQRDEYLRQQGLCVMRFDNLQVMKETESVLTMIVEFAEKRNPPNPLKSPQPPLSKGEFVKGGS